MATSIRIKINDKELKQALRIAPQRIINAMHTSLKRSAVQTQRYFREEITNNRSIHTGELRRSVRFHFNNKLNVVIEPGVGYADFVEKGTRPHWTSVRNLERWAKFRGINPYVLQRSIARKGTKAHPFEKKTAKRATEFAQRDMQRQLDKSIKEIL
jgi:hypothetical protein